LPLFKRQTKEVGEVLPQLYLHGLALGDFELALRGLLGDGARCSQRHCCGSKRSGRANMKHGSSADSMNWKWSTSIWKLLQVAESTFRRLKGAALLPAVYAGTRYVDGVERPLHARQRLAA
jgi:hypothetical protein